MQGWLSLCGHMSAGLVVIVWAHECGGWLSLCGHMSAGLVVIVWAHECGVGCHWVGT